MAMANKKRKKQGRRRDSDRGRKGGMTSMRSGFRNLVRGGGDSQKRSGGSNYIWTLLLIVAIILLILSLTR